MHVKYSLLSDIHLLHTHTQAGDKPYTIGLLFVGVGIAAIKQIRSNV